MMPTAKFRIANSALSGREFVLPDHPVVIGRSSSCDICIPDQSVSRQHVRAEFKDGRCTLRDLGSHNGIIVRGKTVREAVLGSSGERFELGDIVIEFLIEHETVTAAGPAAPPLVGLPANPAVQAAQMPAERPVYVDELFGPAVSAKATGPGEEEKAAVTGARNALTYVGLLAAIVILGAIAWQMASSDTPQIDVKHAIVKAGERLVIDLGAHARSVGARLVPYIDFSETYDAPEECSNEVAGFELDKTGFMATIEGIAPGETDIQIVGARGRRAVVRVLVRGALPRPSGEENLKPEERVLKARLLIGGGTSALRAGYLYQAMKKFDEAAKVLEKVKDAEGSLLHREARQLHKRAADTLAKEFEQIKFQALVRHRDRDTVGAARVWDQLRNLVPDPNDEMNQKLKIIFHRTVYQLEHRGG